MISDKALQEYKELVEAERGEELSDADAMDEAMRVLSIMNAIYRPIKKSWEKITHNNYDRK